MSFFLSDAEWAEYEDAVNAFHNDAFQQPIVWRKLVSTFDSIGREKTRYINDTLLGIIQYNHFRSWPINIESVTGQIDNQSMLLFLNNKYLEDRNLLNSEGQFEFKPDTDRFTVNGVEYVAKGDSQTAQTKNKALLHFIVLKREEIKTSEQRYNE